MLTLAEKSGRPKKNAIGQDRCGLVTEFWGEKLCWSKGDQYLQAGRDEHAFTIGSKSLDGEMDELEKRPQF